MYNIKDLRAAMLYVDPGAEQWVPYARKRAEELETERRNFDIAVVTRSYSPAPGVSVWVQVGNLWQKIVVRGGDTPLVALYDVGQLDEYSCAGNLVNSWEFALDSAVEKAPQTVDGTTTTGVTSTGRVRLTQYSNDKLVWSSADTPASYDRTVETTKDGTKTTEVFELWPESGSDQLRSGTLVDDRGTVTDSTTYHAPDAVIGLGYPSPNVDTCTPGSAAIAFSHVTVGNPTSTRCVSMYVREGRPQVVNETTLFCGSASNFGGSTDGAVVNSFSGWPESINGDLVAVSSGDVIYYTDPAAHGGVGHIPGTVSFVTTTQVDTGVTAASQAAYEAWLNDEQAAAQQHDDANYGETLAKAGMADRQAADAALRAFRAASSADPLERDDVPDPGAYFAIYYLEYSWTQHGVAQAGFLDEAILAAAGTGVDRITVTGVRVASVAAGALYPGDTISPSDELVNKPLDREVTVSTYVGNQVLVARAAGRAVLADGVAEKQALAAAIKDQTAHPLSDQQRVLAIFYNLTP